MSISKNLTEGLQTGFINYNLSSLERYHPKLLVNDHKRGMKVLTNLVQELRQCEEFFFSVAFITNSGVASLINVLDELDKKGVVKGRILTSQYQNFTEPVALKRLLQFKNIELKINTEDNFHGKGYIFKREEDFSFIIGSSNLTQSALSKNKEWNIKLSSLKDGLVMQNILNEFNYSFDQATCVDEKWIAEYSKIYSNAWRIRDEANIKVSAEVTYGQVVPLNKINPNKMQIEALEALELLRSDNKDKALLISATGTGKTFLSAFDAAKTQPKRLLFVVHRENIARAALESYKRIFGESITMGLLTGNSKETERQFLFSTVQTLSKDYTLSLFEKDAFDYIVIDEVHRSGAVSYQKILNYFRPRFLLGMTATPERTDGYDIFKDFNYNIAYEIRLHMALEENMLAPFHYYGISDIEVGGELIDNNAKFNQLTSEERVRHIIQKSKFYGWDHGRVKGLIFCSRVEEAKALSIEFNNIGYSTISLDGDSSEELREESIRRLEQEETPGHLDYIFTVDIFNEGVDIPSLNQIIMLRPTQSAIIFVQQLGRGLRKKPGKQYLTVIDFIGNYANNYMIPVALYGDRTYNKDTVRRLVSSESSVIPGCSTINFDYITRQRIFKSIDNNNLSLRRDLKKDFELLKYELGRVPVMMDFIEHGRREPYIFIEKYKTYYNFLISLGGEPEHPLTNEQNELLRFYSKEVLNGKRVEEGVLLGLLIAKGKDKGEVDIKEVSSIIEMNFGYKPNESTWISVINVLNGDFTVKSKKEGGAGVKFISKRGDAVQIDKLYRDKLMNEHLHFYIDDMIRYSFARYKLDYSKERFRDGFVLYNKYGRKDVCKILNWQRNEEGTIFGYRIKHNTCPLFVTYNKSEVISDSTKYKDEFINRHQFRWMTRNNVKLDSREVLQIKDQENTGLRIPLFIKKSDGEGQDFYYMGDVKPIDYTQTTIMNGKEEQLPVVNILYQMQDSVDEALYTYLVAE